MEKEREFDSVQVKSDSFNKVIKFEDLKVLPNLNDVKQYLLCPTPGCNAKLIWVNAKHPYLKALHNEDHDPKLCSHYREKGAPYHRSSQRTIQVNLPGNAILSRLDRLASSALPSNNPKSRKRGKNSKARKARHKTDTNTKKISTHGQLSDSSSAVSTSEISTRIGRRQINAITNKDIGLPFQMSGQAQKIEQDPTSKAFKITIKEGKAILELSLDNEYFTKEPSYKNQHVYDYILDKFSSIQGPLGVGYLALITAVSTNSVAAKLTRDRSIKFFLWDKSNRRRHYTPLELADKLKKDDQSN